MMRPVILLLAGLLSLASPANANVYTFAETTPGFARFASLMRQTGIDAALANPGPYTIFAPRDAAFAALPTGLDRDRLVQILTCHMVPQRVLTDAVASGATTIRTVGGCRLRLQQTAQGARVIDDHGEPHAILSRDLQQSNGVVHTIDSLILPPY